MMKHPNLVKRLVQIFILLFALGGISYRFGKEFYLASKRPVHHEERNAVVDVQARLDHITAYYFHGNFRCPTCRRIEELSRSAIEKGFADDLKKGILSFETVNIDEISNRHFIKDFNLYTRSLVLVSYAGDKQIRFKNLNNVWDYVRSPDQFIAYVQDEVRDCLREVKR
jgi:hypothetical protein